MELSARSRCDFVQSGAFSVHSHGEASHLSGLSGENPLDLNIF